MEHNTIDLTIETITPLHIGNNHSLTSIGEYVIVDGMVKILNQEKLQDLLKEKELEDEYIDFILNEEINANVWDDFIIKENIDKHIEFIREIPFNKSENFSITSNNLLELFINENNNLYIPGSTIKGVIRSYLFSYLIMENKNVKQKVENAISNNDNLYDIVNRIKNIENGKKIIKKGEKEYEIKEYNELYKQIQVSDSSTIIKDDIIVEISKRVHFFGKEMNDLDVLKECVDSDKDTNIKFKINRDKIKINSFQFLKSNNLDKLFENLNSVSKKYIENEIELLQKSTNKNIENIKKNMIKFLNDLSKEISNSGNKYAIIRIGKGKNFFQQTILPFISSENSDKVLELMLKKRVEKINDNNKNSDNFTKIKLTDYIKTFPQTRVLSGDNKMFGWIKLKK